MAQVVETRVDPAGLGEEVKELASNVDAVQWGAHTRDKDQVELLPAPVEANVLALFALNLKAFLQGAHREAAERDLAACRREQELDQRVGFPARPGNRRFGSTGRPRVLCPTDC